MEGRLAPIIEVLGRGTAGDTEQPIDRAFDAVNFAANFLDVRVDKRIADQRIALHAGVVGTTIVIVAQNPMSECDLHI